jgi:hypothetical protein
LKKKNTGYVLAGAILVLAVLAILIPSILLLTQKDAKDSVAIDLKTKAFQLAEAGQDRGIWKLRESDTTWANAVAGTIISGYHDDVVYADVNGGTYKIKFVAGPAPGQVTVISKGKATNSTDVRAISGIYSKGVVSGALSVVGGLDWKPNLHVEWGPVVAYNSITSTPSDRYPRKYSAGSISGYDTDPTAPNGAMPGENWSAYDYASYYSLGAAPTIDLDSYRALAKKSCVPPLKKATGNSAAAHLVTTCDTGYYTEDASIDKPGGGSSDYTFTCSTCVIFIEGTIKSFPNDSWLDVRALLATGDVDFNAKNTTYLADIPSTAQDEYRYAPTATAYWAGKGWTNGGTYSIANCGMHGFLYSGGDLKNAGGNTILVGALFIAGALSANTTTIYYDSAVANNVLFQTSTISRISWDEIRLAW